MKRFAVIGALDSVAFTLQTFAAVYVPGPLLILLPQAAIPVSLLLTMRQQHNRVTWIQGLGAAMVLLGIGVVLTPIMQSRNAPSYLCQASDRLNDCTACQLAGTHEECDAASMALTEQDDAVASSSSTANDNMSSVSFERSLTFFDTDTAAAPPCQWLSFDQSLQEKEILEIIWSLALIASTIPMAVSAVYKQHAMSCSSISRRRQPSDSNLFTPLLVPEEPAAANPSSSSLAASGNVADPARHPVLYVSSWIAMFQLLFSLFVALPLSIILSVPTVSLWEMPENLYHGMLCYAGYGVVETSCHPDSFCASQHAALWVNVNVLCHVSYTISMMIVLQRSDGGTLLFLALTAIVPLGHLAFSLPWMPQSSQTVVRGADWLGLITIVTGLVFYRFSDPKVGQICKSRSVNGSIPMSRRESRSSLFDDDTNDEESEDGDLFSSLFLPFWPVENQTSFALGRHSIQIGDV